MTTRDLPLVIGPRQPALGGGYDRRSRLRDESATASPTPFDPITVALEPGISLVEASAGTGKTFCITLTVLRLLLDRDAAGEYRVAGIGKILVVTFTNAATDELITRVRAVLRDAADVFSGVVTERTEKNTPLFALLDRYGPGETDRLRQAHASLDQLSIFTIHGFCKRVLEESALESGTPFDAGFLEDDAILVQRVTQDWWRRTIYEDRRLAAIAVRDDWQYDAFLNDLKAWRRWPGTRLDPADGLSQALEGLDRVVAAFAIVWDAARARAFLDQQVWRANAPLGDAVLRERIVDAGTALAGGDLAAGLPFVRHCTAAAIRDDKKGIKLSPKDLFAQVEHEPFVRACGEVDAALGRLRCALRVSCLEDVDRGFDAEKRRRHLLGFDDLLRRLRDALGREGSTGQLAESIRRRYDAALIDEFQDTDPYQFPIFSTAFDGRPLFLIGDPKQAIYGFRGADVFAYMDAAREANRTYTLSRNWRSTARMTDAVSTLFGRQPNAFLYERIPFLPSAAARDPADPVAHDGRGAIHWWFVPAAPGDNKWKMVAKGDAKERIHAALGREIVRLLDAPEDGAAALSPGSIAVLVRTGHEGREIQRLLNRLAVPCIVAGMGDVLESRELQELETVLRAVAAPQHAQAVRAALATEMWGMDAAAIHRLSQPGQEHEWQAIAERLGAARESWVRHGFMRMAQELVAAQGVPERLLGYDDGERRLTNLRHAIELLHSVAVDERLSPEGLLLWIGRARAQKSEDADRTELRLESDADAVQIVTIHKSKGLEYDVVFCPGLWEVRRVSEGDPVLVHEDDGSVVFDHGSPERQRRGRLADAETLAEDLRIAYVALTRARFRCYIGWGAIVNAKTKIGACHSALGYLLRGSEEQGKPEDIAERVATALGESLGAWPATLSSLVDESGGTMSWEILADAGAELARWTTPTRPTAEPRCREPLPPAPQLESWRISSFTSLTASQHVEHARDVADAGAGDADEAPRVPERRDDFMTFPAGRHPGVVVHELFERLDFGATSADVRTLTTEILRRERFVLDESDARIAATAAMAERVVGTILPGLDFALRDVPRSATLREWKFHLPLGTIDRRSFADLFAAHGGEVARRYAPALRAIPSERTYGFLTGVVDLAFEKDCRWYVVDWKSNHLGREPERYGRDALEHEMSASHYVLQYHLYVTALHRFLRARLPGYDYDRHMGDVCYAFLRGIDGSGRGWFHDRPARALVEALDALMGAPTIAASRLAT